MINETFIVENSRIQQLEPRVKIAFATIYSFVVALSSQFSALLAAVFLSLLLVRMAGLNFWEVTKRLAVINGFIFFLWLVLPLTFAGEPLFNLGPLTVTRQGVILSAQITLKSNAILLVIISLIATMPLATFGHALNHLRIPEKIVHLLLMTYRYIFVIEFEYLRLIRAAKIRGFRAETSMHTYRTYAYLIGMLFVRAAVRAERVCQAMQCRGFKGKFYSLQEFQPSRLNWIFSMLMSAVIIGLVICNILAV